MPTPKKRRPADPREAMLLLVRAKEANRALLLSKPYVIGLDVGYRVRAGEATDELVVKVIVSRKLEQSRLAKQDLIPSRLKIDDQEVPVDVEEGTIPQPHLFTLRSRPLRGGSSIGPVTPALTGTLGICVTLNDGNTYILSCNHVLAATNVGPIGLDIVQPSLGDGGNALEDVVADLSNFVALDFGTTTITIFGITITIPNPNFVDAALARVRRRFNDGDRNVHWIGYPDFRAGGTWGFFEKLALLGRRVCKMGRTTEFTAGTIVSTFYDTRVGPYANGGFAWFEDQIRIRGDGGAFSAPGDSGSLVVDFETKEPIGLLFSGSTAGSNANPLDQVLSRLGIREL